MRKKIAYGILLLAVCLGFFYMIYQWKELNCFSHQSGLRYETGMLSGAQIEEYNKKQRESAEKQESSENVKSVGQMEITAWKMEWGQEIYQPQMQQRVEGNVIKVYGNMARVFPFSMKYGGFTFQEDGNGCVISSGLAWKLFGAEDVVGNVIQYEEKEYQVRGVLDSEESIFALYQTKKEEMMPYVEVWSSEVPPATRMEEIKSSLGLFQEGYMFHGSFYCSIARILVALPFWIIFFFLFRCFFKWCRSAEGKYAKWYGLVGKILMVLGIAIGIRYSISFTRDFVPAQWSDFSFWSGKWKEIVDGIKGRKEFPGIYWEQEVLGIVGRIVGGVVWILTGGVVFTHSVKKSS